MTAIDWKLLIGVRERHKTTALEAVARDRRALQASQDQAQAAQAQWHHQVQTQAAHWQATSAALAGGGFKAAQLREAAAGSQALDAQIARAGQAAAQARELVSQHEARLDTSRGGLRAAEGELEKARQMQQRVHAQQLRAGELRQEDATEELAVQKWQERWQAVAR